MFAEILYICVSLSTLLFSRLDKRIFMHFFPVSCCMWCPDISDVYMPFQYGNMAVLIHHNPFQFLSVTTGSPQL